MKQSAGILVFRHRPGFECFLVHPGGPFFAKKDKGWWSIPKGEPEPGEALPDAALREFEEETGLKPPPVIGVLTPVLQKNGKKVYCWIAEGDLDATSIKCNSFEMEWPPRSGRYASFPEVDRAAWFDAETARQQINERQAAFIDELLERLSSGKLNRK